MAILVNSDFTGKYELTLNQFTTGLIDDYITKYEKNYLLKMLGSDLYSLFVDDLVDGEPVTAIYLNIFNAFDMDYCDSIVSSNGIKEMLKGFIYYHYILDNQQIQTSIGTTSPNAENSTVIAINSLTVSRYNDSVYTFQAIQDYISINSSDYPDFNGQEQKYNYHF